MREHAIQIAGRACARALEVAVARNPLFVARFVDDALRALGESEGACVRVHPAAAALISVEGRQVVPDERMAMGDVAIERGEASVSAKLHERAAVLARAIADA